MRPLIVAWLGLLLVVVDRSPAGAQQQFALEGRVVDEAGQPVRGVRVKPLYGLALPVPTQREGRFRFARLPKGEVHLLTMAKGRATCVTTVELRHDTADLNIVLLPAKEMRFRVVDNAGEPVPEVDIYNERLGDNFAPIFRATTDGDGRATWTQPPDFPVEYNFTKPGFAKLTVKLTTDGSEQTIALLPSVRFSGALRDADSGEPVRGARFTRIQYNTPLHPYAYRYETQTFDNGEFDWELRDAGHDHLVQIEALGYETARLGPYRVGDMDQHFDLPMKAVPPQAGVVVGCDGKPTGAAQVLLASKFQSLSLDSSFRVDNHVGNLVLTPEDDGRFEIPWQLDPYTVVALADQGYAETRRAAGEPPGVIQLQPWAKVRGTVRQNGQPVAEAQVSFEPIRDPANDARQFMGTIWVTTDENGRFQMDRVPPISGSVAPFLHFSQESLLTSSHSMPVQPQPGQELDLEFGGGGAEIRCKLALDPPAESGFDYHFSLNYLVAIRPGIEPPPTLTRAGFNWVDGWNENWRTSSEGLNFLQCLHHYFVKPDPDGQISIQGVAPGEYDLALKLYDRTEGCLIHPRGERVLRVTVPEQTSSLDLGEVVVSALKRPMLGEVVEEFTVQGSDDQAVQLSEFRGKYLLLDFWASWCGPCVAKFDDVEKLRQTYADSLGLVVMGMNLDADPKDGRRCLAARNPVPWRQAFLGDWSETDVPQRFAISSVPAYVLIDPEGRLVEQSASLDSIANALAEKAKP